MEVSEFLSVVQNSGEYTRPNQFELTIVTPPKVQIQNDVLRRVAWNCRRCPIPGRAIAAYEYTQGGVVTRRMAHSQIFPEVTLTFNLSEDKVEKTLFDEWQNSIFDPVYQNLSYYRDYVGALVVTPKSKRPDRKLVKYTYMEAWPVAVSEVELSMDETDSIAQLNVTFAYHSWRRDASDS